MSATGLEELDVVGLENPPNACISRHSDGTADRNRRDAHTLWPRVLVSPMLDEDRAYTPRLADIPDDIDRAGCHQGWRC